MQRTALALEVTSPGFEQGREDHRPGIPLARTRSGSTQPHPRPSSSRQAGRSPRIAVRSLGARAERCGVCGCGAVEVDFVDHGAGMLGLGECTHCQYRFTFAPST